MPNFAILKPVSLFNVGDVVPPACFGGDAPRLVSLGAIAPTEAEATAGVYDFDRQESVSVPGLSDASEAALQSVDALVKLAAQLDAALSASRKEVADLRRTISDLSQQVAVAIADPVPAQSPVIEAVDASDPEIKPAAKGKSK